MTDTTNILTHEEFLTLIEEVKDFYATALARGSRLVAFIGPEQVDLWPRYVWKPGVVDQDDDCQYSFSGYQYTFKGVALVFLGDGGTGVDIRPFRLGVGMVDSRDFDCVPGKTPLIDVENMADDHPIRAAYISKRDETVRLEAERDEAFRRTAFAERLRPHEDIRYCDPAITYEAGKAKAFWQSLADRLGL